MAAGCLPSIGARHIIWLKTTWMEWCISGYHLFPVFQYKEWLEVSTRYKDHKYTASNLEIVCKKQSKSATLT